MHLGEYKHFKCYMMQNWLARNDRRNVFVEQRRVLIFLFTLCFSVPTFSLPQVAQIIPPDGVSIVQDSETELTIKQSVDRAIIIWQNFDIHANEKVKFFHDYTHFITLNKVEEKPVCSLHLPIMSGHHYDLNTVCSLADQKPTKIEKSLSASGRIFIVNKKGFCIGKVDNQSITDNSYLNSDGVIISTLDIDNNQFLDGNFRFFSDPLLHTAEIKNAGRISSLHFIILLSHDINNKGNINNQIIGVPSNNQNEAEISLVVGAGSVTIGDKNEDGILRILSTENGQIRGNITNNGIISTQKGNIKLITCSPGSQIEHSPFEKNSLDQSSSSQDTSTSLKGEISAGSIHDNLILEGSISFLGEGESNIKIANPLFAYKHKNSPPSENEGRISVSGKSVVISTSKIRASDGFFISVKEPLIIQERKTISGKHLAEILSEGNVVLSSSATESERIMEVREEFFWSSPYTLTTNNLDKTTYFSTRRHYQIEGSHQNPGSPSSGSPSKQNNGRPRSSTLPQGAAPSQNKQS